MTAVGLATGILAFPDFFVGVFFIGSLVDMGLLLEGKNASPDKG
jgi:hypothetical protein